MALSFEDSIRANSQQENAVSTSDNIHSELDVMPLSIEDEPMVMSLSIDSNVATRNSDNWQIDYAYDYYQDFNDEDVSVVGDDKIVTLNPKQIGISREENSQFIPFEMPRYYDGVDLSNTVLYIHFEDNSGEYHNASKAINVKYNTDKIRFGWLIDEKVTGIVGKIKFEIQARGTISNSNGNVRSYVWKTRPNSELNILQSICDIGCHGVIDIDSNWYQEMVTDIAYEVASQIADINVAAQVEEAKAAAVDASTYAEEAKTYADQAASAASEEVNKIINNYATTAYVDEAVASVDVTEQLADYARIEDVYTKSDTNAYVTAVLENYATDEDVANAIADADITGKLENYYTKNETYSKSEVDDAIGNVEVDLTGYATETYVDNKTDALSSSIGTNTSNISSLSSTVTGLQNIVNNIDTSPRLTYNAVYNDAEDPDVGKNVFVLYEITNEGTESEEKDAKAKFTIVGGSGGGDTSSTLKIEYVTTSPIVATTSDDVVIKYNFSGVDSSGDAVTEGAATWKVGGKIVATNIAVAGKNSFDVTEYLSIGTQKVNLTIVDDAGSLVTKNWTVQKVDVRLESSFNDKLTYPIGAVSFGYTPYGAIPKTIHFKLDGVEIGTVETASSGIPMAYDIPSQSHGAHLFEVYITAEINGNTIESNHIVKDIIWYDTASDVPVIGCTQQNFTARQYDSTNIVYTVYDPNTETPVVTLAIDDEIVSTLTIDSNTQTWQYKSSDVGVHTLTITCGTTVKTLTATIEKIDINLEPVTAGLVFDFNPSGKSNNDVDRLWSYGDIAMSVSDNFDWTNGGYHIDENGDQYFCIKAGTSAVINYNLFADDAKRNGKEFKLIFKTTNVDNAKANFLSCVDGADNSKIGIEMNVHEAYIHASAGSLYLPYSEEDIIEFEFNINKNTDDIPMVMGYEDGVATRPMIYSSTHDFTQINPQYITIGSDNCDVFIYRFKVYNTALTDRGILNNFIADARNAEEMISRYNRNQIYDENNQITPETLAEKCPHLRIIKIEAPHFTNNKSDKVPGTTIQYIYKSGDPVLDNWTAYNSMHSGQGTTSNEYGAAGRNLDLIMNKSGIDGVNPYIKLGDESETNKISLTRDSVEVNYLNVKVNIASSENANNALLQRRYNIYNPYVSPAKQNNPKVKDTMEFYNCVVFIKESDTDLTTHREFQDNDWHFYAIGNIGDSKKTDKTRLNDPDDPLECVVEIMDNTFPNSTFPGDEEGLANLELDPFDESMTYGWRYSYDDENPAVTGPCIEAWKTFYKFVVQSTDEEFKANLKDYFVVDSALFFYLFTTRYTMIDNRAKNTFWHYGKCSDGVYRWDLCWDYDNDSALGINNSGELTMTYGYEDTDYKTKGDASTGYAFNAATSTFFCRIRDLFVDELRDMFVRCESANAWSAEGLISQFDSWQSEFPEELWRLDIERKYLRSYREGAPRFLTTMMQGRKKYQRRQFERNQEKYMASKFFGNVAVSDQIMFRCNTPTDENLVVQPDYTLHLTPYADMYIDVLFGATYRTQVRAEAGKQYDITCPFTTMDDTAVLIYCSSLIQSMGDISACYIHDNDFSKASKLKELIIGNATEGYQNSFLTNLGIGNNTLLEKLDIQNTPNLVQSLNLSSCGNLRELYAHGSGLTGVEFADGGMIEIAELPSVNALTMKNLIYLATFNVTSFNNLTTLIIENCNTVDLQSILNIATNINRVRIVGIDWSLEDTSLLEAIYKMSGVDKNGYNITQSVLAGKVHVPVIRQQQLYDYQDAWSDLTITFDTMIEQFAVTFVNDDGTVLDVQYVDKGSDAVDPITRAENPIAIPTKESTVSTDFAYDGWDSSLKSIFDARIIKATYTESTRAYTIRYVSKGTVMQESTGLYGDNIVYDGVTPTYTLEESAYKYYLFNRWDKSGFIDGDKTVNAIFDSFEYKATSFDGKQLSDLTPVEIYALTQLGLDNVNIDIQDGDDYSFELGHDVDYDDIESQTIITDNTNFTGSNYIDTGIKLLDVDRDFVIAIDYEFLSGNSNGCVLAQCFQSNGANGFKLWYNGSNNSVNITWGTSSYESALVGNREMIILRHKKGDNNLTVYTSNLSGSEVNVNELTRTKSTITDSTLVFGCLKADDGAYENYAIGDVNWCKVWYKDLGDAACKKLACWTHEKINLEVCSFKKYYLSDNPSKRCSFTMLATHLLSKSCQFGDSYSYTGGWAESSLNRFLNSRLYEAVPTQIKSLIKKVTVSSSIGNKSTETSDSQCYIYVPAAIEMSNESRINKVPYTSELTNPYTISYMINNEARKRAYVDGDYVQYWLRSPNVEYANYIYTVNSSGEMYGYVNAPETHGVLIELSF